MNLGHNIANRELVQTLAENSAEAVDWLYSIDALELIVMIEKRYGIKIKDPAAGKDIFKSVNTMAAFIEQNRVR